MSEVRTLRYSAEGRRSAWEGKHNQRGAVRGLPEHRRRPGGGGDAFLASSASAVHLTAFERDRVGMLACGPALPGFLHEPPRFAERLSQMQLEGGKNHYPNTHRLLDGMRTSTASEVTRRQRYWSSGSGTSDAALSGDSLLLPSAVEQRFATRARGSAAHGISQNYASSPNLIGSDEVSHDLWRRWQAPAPTRQQLTNLDLHGKRPPCGSWDRF